MFDLFSPPLGGGTVTIIHKISRALAGKGHEVMIYSSDFQLDRDYINSLAGVNVHPFHCVSSIGNFFFTPALVGEARKSLRDFDIIHLHCFRSFQNIVIHHYARKYGVPYVLDAHGSLPRTTRGGRNLKWLLKWLYDITCGHGQLRDAVRLVAETRGAVDEYTARGVSRDRIVQITPPFDIQEFSDLPARGRFRQKYGITARHLVLFLGRIHWIKGLGFLVEAFGELVKSMNDVVLVVAGPDDGYLSALTRKVNELDLSARVLFTGFISGREKLAALVDADVVVQTSVYEQGTGVPFEAVLCGTPIIVSRDTVASANVKDIDAGYLVEYGNHRELVGTLQRVLDDPAEARDKAQRAREYIKANLSLEKGVEKYEELYREAIGSA
ncbi:MAG: hypothetical protein A2Z05_06630 [Chloroflexi bacterium RBG_16_60_22]|nr:MAG: hypothetical protein A2Z05_06630 [Chloroflexi bacterium RBG_16_60_22]